jgi:hypothetical protein
MADEIRIKTQLTVKNGFVDQSDNVNYTANQTAAGGPTPGYVTIGTSEETVAFGELGTKGWLWMRNLDATNFVEWGFATGVYGGKMLAGESAGPFRMNATSVYLKSDTGACKCLVNGYEA